MILRVQWPPVSFIKLDEAFDFWLFNPVRAVYPGYLHRQGTGSEYSFSLKPMIPHGIVLQLSRVEYLGPTFDVHPQFKKKKMLWVIVGNVVSDLWTLDNCIVKGSSLSVALFQVAVNGLVDGIHPGIRKLFILTT